MFQEILNRVYDFVGCDRMYVELKLFMRYPMPGKYVPIALEDDESLSAIWLSVTQSSAMAMEVYIEQVPKEINVQSNVGYVPLMEFRDNMDVPTSAPNMQFESFTSMLLDPHYVNQHMNEFISLGSSPHIPSTFHLDTLHQNDVDFLGNEEEHVDSDRDEDDDARELADKAIKAGVPSQDWLRVDEVDKRLIDSWMTWNCTGSLTVASEFEIGQEFASLQQLKNFVKAWSISRNQMFWVLESEPTKYVIECARKEVCHCPWRLRAIMTKSFAFKIVRYVGPHASNYLRDITCGDHPLISSDFVADLIEDFIRTDPSFKVQSILTFVKNQYQFSIAYKRAWLAKQKAISNIFGDWDKSYQELPRYLQALKKSNRGTVVYWCTLPTQDPTTHIFKRVFWAFKPSISGFRHCRPLITIDATHLYGKYKGKLLIAMGTDANFQLFPLAFAVVEEESTEDWSWFLACIRRSVTDRKDLCVISDRHRVILAAMNEPQSGWEEPYAHHRFCVRHLASNLNSKYKNAAIKNLFGKAAYVRHKTTMVSAS
ncbi:uncharacterized protein LOC104893315 [Beta vulgaris subsp. vulgaris]|uniref:uncharacterized protein LOC104893315 n=1 Tax=Beta vulgaris subsp. vulgaris TaxID=3555 RepID=UPI0020368167|nr:uncharacterized protein LOC104893315 [Beta vulgaris subsp. vulgaris]